ncbi:MAG: DUF951 domain-containing protein [Chloroflexi bacterium]|nr:DUF951 domain-containing protein [Chloroflexota bacterium]
MEVKLGDIVRLKKKHPCGVSDREAVRLGADIGTKCLKCHHRLLLEGSLFERRVRDLVTQGK